MTKNLTKETKNKYRRSKKAAKKAVARAMKKEAVRKSNELCINPNNVLRLVRKMKIESTDVVKGTRTQENDGTFYLNEKDRAKL